MNINGWCPLLSSTHGESDMKTKCVQANCAWWDQEDNCCVTFSINKYVRRITNNGLYDLHDINSTLSGLKD